MKNLLSELKVTVFADTYVNNARFVLLCALLRYYVVVQSLL